MLINPSMSKGSQDFEETQESQFKFKSWKADSNNGQGQMHNKPQRNLLHDDEISSSTSPYLNEAYTVGWICALPIEMAAAKGMMDEEHGDPQTPPQQVDQNAYLLGCIRNFRVVVACLPKHEIGSSSAAAVARDMLHTFPNIRVGLLVGIGAGIPAYESDEIRDIRLGDVVISSDKENGGVILYDFGQRLADGSFESMYALDRPPRPLRAAISKLEAEHETRENKIPQYIDRMLEKYPYMRKKGYTYPGSPADQLFKADYMHMGGRSCAKCDAEERVNRKPDRLDSNPVIHYGVIATGSAVVKHTPTREEITQKYRAICLEMEAAGLMNNFPCVVIRGISDYADSHKNDQWQPYAAATAAACAKELLEHIQSRALEGERTAKDIFSQILNDTNRIGEDVQGISKKLHKNDDIQVLNWLTQTDYGPQQTDFLARRQKGTGQWLLDSKAYQTWLNTSQKTLFCPGIPGAGKTILTSIVIDDLCQRYHRDGTIGIAYIYCNYRRRDEHRVEDLLASLLKQLAQCQSSLPASLKDMYDRHQARQTWPSLEEISRALHSVAAMYSGKTFIIVDALDECRTSNGCRSRFLAEIFGLQAKAKVNFYATSRSTPDIDRDFRGCISLKIVATPEDVHKYLEGNMTELPGFVLKRRDLQEEIKREITGAVEGMFLLAQLYLDSLQDKTSVREIRKALKELRRRSQGTSNEDKMLDVLAEAYEDAMERINGQKLGFRSLAKKVISWITHARRPLTALELQNALAVNIGDRELDKENLREIEDMVSVCAGLVTVDEESSIIRLAHYTTQEYFERTWTKWFPNAQVDITEICVTYLSFDVFETGFCGSDRDFEARLESNVLYDYAARNWGHHVRTASTEESTTLKLLNSRVKVSAASQAMMAFGSYDEYSQHVPRQMTRVHVAAYFGLAEIIKGLLKSGDKPDLQDSYGRTPLSYAAEYGHETVVMLLLGKSAQVDSEDEEGRTPLSYTAEKGYEVVMKLLLKHGAQVDSEDKDRRTPLSYTAENGFDAVMKLLLEKDAQVDSKDEDGRTPLLYAAERGQEAVVTLLLEKGANLDSEYTFGPTPLLYAAQNGSDAVVKLLLEKGAEVDSRRRYGPTPLSYAAQNGFDAVVELLLRKGAQVNSESGYDRTPLSYAAERGHNAVVKLLIESGAELEAKDAEYGQTPLLYAAERGYEAIIELLLEKGAQVNAMSRYGWTPLFYAAESGNEAVMRQLLKKGAQVNFTSKYGWTSLSYAAENGHEAVVKLLLENGAEVESKNRYGRTPLSYAAENGHEAVVRLLSST